MGPKLYRVTIFFGPHVPNFLQAPSCLVLMLSNLQQPPTCCSHAQDASPKFELHSVLFNSGQRCVDLSRMENFNFRWNPNFIIESPCSLVANFLDAPSSLVLLFSDLQGRLHVVRMRKMPHQDVSSIAFFLTQVNTVSIWAVWKIIVFGVPKLYDRITMFFGCKLSGRTIFFGSAVFRLATAAYMLFARARCLTRI